jgi:hypothetical protein
MKKLMNSFNTKTSVFLFALFFTAFASNAQNTTQLNKGSDLTTGNSIFSPDGKYKITLESNGNMVLYNNNTQVWQSNTAGQGATKLSLQNDGNLVLNTASNQSKWAASSNNTAVQRLVLSNDGNLLICNNHNAVLWALKDASGSYTTNGSNMSSSNHPFGNYQDGKVEGRSPGDDPNIGTNIQY